MTFTFNMTSSTASVATYDVNGHPVVFFLLFIQTFCIITWYFSLSTVNMNKLRRIVNICFKIAGPETCFWALGLISAALSERQ